MPWNGRSFGAVRVWGRWKPEKANYHWGPNHSSSETKATLSPLSKPHLPHSPSILQIIGSQFVKCSLGLSKSGILGWKYISSICLSKNIINTDDILSSKEDEDSRLTWIKTLQRIHRLYGVLLHWGSNTPHLIIRGYFHKCFRVHMLHTKVCMASFGCGILKAYYQVNIYFIILIWLNYIISNMPSIQNVGMWFMEPLTHWQVGFLLLLYSKKG